MPRAKTAKTAKPADEPTLRLDAARWHTWLSANHAAANAALVMISKKGAPPPHLSYAEALEVALIWGWIDGVKRPHDAHVWIQRFTPRRAKSAWSKINRTKAEALIASGKMQPSGLAEVERARQDGRWARAYDSASKATVPDDLAAAVAANRAARAFFPELDSTNRYAILYRVQTAKTPETRAARIATFVAMLARRETLHAPRVAKRARATRETGATTRTARATARPPRKASSKPAPRRGTSPRRARRSPTTR